MAAEKQFEPNTKTLRTANGRPMPDRGPRPPTSQIAAPWRLLLQIESENRTTVGLALTERALLGRVDDAETNNVDLDLTPYGAVANGVSRVHAAVSYHDAAVYIEDLGSTNGTRINGFELTPHQAYRLRDGDELEFGRLRMVARFVRSSP
jgi:hypothetical protein